MLKITSFQRRYFARKKAHYSLSIQLYLNNSFLYGEKPRVNWKSAIWSLFSLSAYYAHVHNVYFLGCEHKCFSPRFEE